MTDGGILVSSSPSRAIAYDDSYLQFSSPDFPSISDLLAKPAKKPPLRSGSRAAPIPEDAVKSFTSAASVWRSAQTETIAIDSPSPLEEALKPRAKSTVRKKPAVAAPVEPPPKLSTADFVPAQSSLVANSRERRERAETPVETSKAADRSSPFTEKAWKKFKSPSPKDKSDVQTTLPKGKVTKLARKTKTTKPKVKGDTTSRYFATASDEPEPEPIMLDVDEPIELEPAPKRRTDWTPPQEHTARHPTHSTKPTGDGTRAVFATLHEAYCCRADETTPEPTASGGEGDIFKKRKVIEMIAAGDGKARKSASPVKSKAPKKKPRTITELATAAYAGLSDSNDSAAPEQTKRSSDSLLNYFPVNDGELAFNPGHPASKPRKGLSKAGPKGGGRKKNGARPTRQNVLLSPTSAMRQSSGQDFVFGTSSQLAGEESPTFLRELQMAIKVSNQLDDDDPFASPSAGHLAARATPEGRLWSAAARGTHGDLIDIEVIDLVDSPAFPEDPLAGAFGQRTTAPERRNMVPAPRDPPEPLGSDPFDSPLRPLIVGRDAAADSRSEALSLATQQNTTNTAATALILSSSPDPPALHRDDSPDDEPPPSNQEVVQLTQPPTGSSQAAMAAPTGVPRPKYELFTDAQLAREISSYGFKPVKKRTAMIALLDQCWASKNRTTVVASSSTSLQQTAAISTGAKASRPRTDKAEAAASSTNTTAPPARSRGQPKKNGASTVTPVAPVVQPQNPTKKPRGRPKKAAAAAIPEDAPSASLPPSRAQPRSTAVAKQAKSATQPALEILDSESEDPFSSPERTFSSPPAVDVSIGEDIELSLNMSPTTQESALFGFITKAVTTAPPSKDPLNPSWHEKMLMYDPVVLEDLTAWLNAGQLDRVGYDGEVAPLDVKKWCESKSLCCLWKVNLHGKERKRF